MTNTDQLQRERFLRDLTACETALRAFVAGALPSAEERADFFQEVVLILWRSYSRYDPQRPFAAWAMGVAVLRMKSEYRRRARRPGLLSPAALELLADNLTARALPAARDGEADALEECLRSLPLHAAQLMRRRYEDDASIETMSTESGQTVASIYKSLSRIRLALGDCIRKRLSPPASSTLSLYEH